MGGIYQLGKPRGRAADLLDALASLGQVGAHYVAEAGAHNGVCQSSIAAHPLDGLVQVHSQPYPRHECPPSELSRPDGVASWRGVGERRRLGLWFFISESFHRMLGAQRHLDWDEFPPRPEASGAHLAAGPHRPATWRGCG